jgi:hypothetical protein
LKVLFIAYFSGEEDECLFVPCDIGSKHFESIFTFQTGRVDCATAPYGGPSHLFAEPTWNNDQVLDFFATIFDMTPEEVSCCNNVQMI